MNNKYQKKYADLHIHSSYSDGTFSPEEIFIYAKRVGLNCVSITDHDTVACVENAMQKAAQLNFDYIPGIEFSVNWKKPVHILAYFIDHKNTKLLCALNNSLEFRVSRVKLIIEKLKNFGLPVDYNELTSFINMTTPGRPHIAQYLVHKKIVRKFDDAFQKYLTPGKPGYVEKLKLELKETIDLINAAGGVVVLAHPLSLHDDNAVEELIKLGGIEGIEAYYTGHTQNDVMFYLRLAEKYNLLVTGGSDCHGAAKEEIYTGKIKLKYEYVEKLKEYAETKKK